METFWEYFSVLAPSVGLALIFWLVMRSLFRVDTGEREAKAELEEREAEEWARLQAQGSRGDTAAGAAGPGVGAAGTGAQDADVRDAGTGDAGARRARDGRAEQDGRRGDPASS